MMPGSRGWGCLALVSRTMFAPHRAALMAIAKPMPRLPPDIGSVPPAKLPELVKC